MEAAHIPNRGVAPTVPLLDRFPWPPSKSFRISEHSQWIERAFQKAKAFQASIGPVPDWQIPQEITSLALDLTWRVLTLRDDMKSVVVRETSATTLVMHGATDDATDVLQLCRRAEDRGR
jgi:hypothetical protein